MNKTDRIQKLNQLFHTRRYPIPVNVISAHLECSEKTAYRLCRELIDVYGAPINENIKGHRFYDLSADETFELPGLWFNSEELHALLAAHQYLSLIEPGLLDRQLTPLKQRIEKILTTQHQNAKQTLQRIRILGIGNRHHNIQHFNKIASGVLEQKQLHIHYTSRGSNRNSERNVSPQRLTHYRDNWYLDAWCHQRNNLRTFALDQISTCLLLDQPAKVIADATLDQHLASAYGIFAGEADNIAQLKFNSTRARWVEKEHWHPQQQGWYENEYYRLSLPYHHAEELIMDILKYGPDVEVLAPNDLRSAVRNKIGEMAEIYQMD